MDKETLTIKESIELVIDEMIKLGYQTATINAYKRIWQKFIKFSEKASAANFTEELGFSFLKETYNWPNPDGYQRKPAHAARCIRTLGDFKKHGMILRGRYVTIKEWHTNFQPTLNDFKQYAFTNDISEKTIFRIEQLLDKFFTYLYKNGITECSNITLNEIDGFSQTLSGYAKKTLAVSMYSLRIFLTYLYESKILDIDLRKHVPTIRHVNRRSIPTTWSKEESEKILNSVERTNPTGKRDYVILLLMAKLGLRQCDIISLTFKNLDWENNLIKIIQTKTKRSLALPMTNDIGNAIIDYLQNARPKSDLPFVFLKQVYPFQQMKTVYMLMDKYVRISGVKRKPGGTKGPHTLRHSLAGRMLENQIPVEIISAVLGHSSIHSTNDYLKINFRAISECAIDPDEIFDGGFNGE